jgi:hypothetical protein
VVAIAIPAGSSCGRDGAGAGAPDASVDRTGLASITLSYAGGELQDRLQPTFDPATRSYTAEVGLWLQRVQVTAIPDVAGAAVTIAGSRVDFGQPSRAIALDLGDTSIPIEVTSAEGDRRTYTIDITRAAEVAQQAYAKASNSDADDLFGYSTALWGDTLAVGAFRAAGETGAVYVFTRNGKTWSEQAYLEAPNAEVGDEFGASVALWGDTLVVGADGEDGGDQNDSTMSRGGAAYVFTRSGATWTQQAYLKAPRPSMDAFFGGSVAVWHDTIAISAPGEFSFHGGAYVFTRAGTTWTWQADLEPIGPADGPIAFGYRLALWGDTIAVTAPGDDGTATGVNGDDGCCATNSGAVYVFTRTGATWTQQAYVKASNTGANDFFGESVALWGDTLAVGAQLEDSPATGVDGDQGDDLDNAISSGAVYVFTREGETWSQQAYLKASNTDWTDGFGGSVALWGDALAVGALGEDSAATGLDGDQADDSAPLSGAVYMFTRSGGAWSQVDYVKASNTGERDLFSRSVALWGDTLAVGAHGEASAARGVDGSQIDDSARDSGAVYVLGVPHGSDPEPGTPDAGPLAGPLDASPPDAAPVDAGPCDPTVWNLAADFRVSPDQQNPSQDSCGNPDVWHYLDSATLAHDPSTYSLLVGHTTALIESNGLEGWFDPNSGFEELPHVAINSSGSDMNPLAQIVWPAGAVLVHPTPTRLAIVGWKSPITGTVAVTGQAIDRNGGCATNGILWFVAHGGSDLASGVLDEGDAQDFSAAVGGAALAAVDVSAGDFLYFIVDPRDGEFSCDSTQLDVTITATQAP